MKKNMKVLILVGVVCSVSIGAFFIINMNKKRLVIINKSQEIVQELLLKGKNGEILFKVPEIKGNSKENINLKDLRNSNYINLEHYYDQDQSCQSILIKDEAEKKKKFKVIINTKYNNGNLDIEVK